MSIFRIAAEIEENGQSGVYCVIISSVGSTPRRTGSKMIVFPDGQIVGSVGGGEIESRVISDALDALKKNITKKEIYNLVNPLKGDLGVCGGAVEVLMEPIKPKPVCLVVGGGHVGRAVIHLAKWLGFKCILVDDREQFCNDKSVPGADQYIHCDMREINEHFSINGNVFIVFTTRGSDIDVQCLPPILRESPAYIGIIGSKRRWILTSNSLLKLGFVEEDLNIINSPIGIEVNAETPEEIAVSIMAEILIIRNGASGKSMNYFPSKNNHSRRK